jgi:short-subunit dehydrogenase
MFRGAAAPYFKSQNSGRYINMTSTSGLIGNFGQANYAAAKLGIAALSKSMALDMAKYKVTSNCIAPFAWSRMIGTIPAETPDQKARLEKLKRMETAKIAPMAVYLASDASQGVTGQIFAVRANEIFLMSQNRPLRSVHPRRGAGRRKPSPNRPCPQCVRSFTHWIDRRMFSPGTLSDFRLI